MKKIISILSLIILIFQSNACQKAYTNEINEEDLVNQIYLSREFKSTVENLNEISELTKTTIDMPITHSAINQNNFKKSILNELELAEVLKNLGYNNSQVISKKTFEFKNNMSKVFIKFPVLQKIGKERVEKILINAYNKNRFTENHVGRMDMCSDGYADGREDCDDSFGYAMIGLVIGSAGTGPFAPGLIAGGGALLYHEYNNCYRKVYERWKRCRAQNPIG